MIKDTETRVELDKVKQELAKIKNVKPLPKDATIEQIVEAINRITNNLKRK